MKDQYPRGTTIPEHCLVEADAQPDYTSLELPQPELPSNIAYRLADAHVAAGRGDLIAAVHAESGRTYTFTDLARESARLAAGLVRRGVRAGDRIAYRSANDPDALIVMLAIWRAGGVVVPIPAQANRGDIRHFVDDTGVRIVFAHSNAGPLEDVSQAVTGTNVEEIIGFGPGHEEWACASWNQVKCEPGPVAPATHPDQVAIVWHTGGTTGRPKGCYHTHRRFLLGGYAYGAGTGADVGQRWAAAAPLGHALGIIHSTIFTLLHGASVIFVERYGDAQALLRAIGELRVARLTALMSTWAKMADAIRAGAPADLSSLRICFAMWQSASSADLFEFWLSRGVRLLNNFGSTSFANWVLVPPPGQTSPRRSLGRPLPGYQVEAAEVENGAVRILQRGAVGRVAVRGPTGLTYWNLPDLQRRDVVDGWTLSDDLVRFDEAGNAHYLGRTDYMISTGGYKVAPAEVEQALATHPAVREVAVVPGPCPVRQQMVVAYISLCQDIAGTDQLKEELKRLVKSQLPSYKSPQRIEFVDALPRDALGKVQTKVIVQWAAAQSG
jgi:2-aminobenzoate-CoA ligase